MRAVPQTKRGRSGQILPVTAILMTGMVALTGLVLDGGMIYNVKRRMQTAADAAAMGGAQELFRGNTSLVTAAARADSSLNGFTEGVNSTTVTVNNPPLSGPRTGDNRYVEVIISRPVATTFMRMLNRQYSTVKSRAVGGLAALSDYCVIALDPDDRAALSVAGGATLNAGCGVMVNSNNDRGIETMGGGCIYSNDVGVVGGWAMNGSANCILPNGPVASLPPALDPLAYLTPPARPLIALANKFKITGGTAAILPGRYDGGIEISGGTVTFLPGVYYLDGGGLKISGGANVTGNGVMFYNTKTGGGPWGEFSITGSGLMDFRAPDSGPYEGMLFWNDRLAPSNNPQSNIAGNTSSRFEGALYFPSSTLNYSGTSTAANWTIIVANTISFTGNTQVNSNYNATTIQPPTRRATLTE
jgi:hypothetical protein